MSDPKRYIIFIAGERMGGAIAHSPEEAVKLWIAQKDGRPVETVAESHHCRVADIWAEEAGVKVYS
jgi:hypothetical protein